MQKLIHIVALLVLTGPVAYAHTELSESVPADKAVVEAAPKEVMLHFSEAVRLTALSVTKQGDAKQDLGPLPAETSPHFAVPAPALAMGNYAVSWRALSGDGHVLSGEFSFTVGMAHSQHSEHSQAR